ncbi:hypothetical protein [Pararhizobium arenae]|nr:hypothetical protein [Pararhizobium arenae]
MSIRFLNRFFEMNFADKLSRRGGKVCRSPRFTAMTGDYDVRRT